MLKKGTRNKGRGGDLILLKDLVPRKDPKGGAGKSVFGGDPTPLDLPDEASEPPRFPDYPVTRPGGKKRK